MKQGSPNDFQTPPEALEPLIPYLNKDWQELFKKYGLQVIFFDKRINFETPDGTGSGSWFASAWFTFGLNLPKDMNFVKLKEIGK